MHLCLLTALLVKFSAIQSTNLCHLLSLNYKQCSLLSSPTKGEQGVESIHHYFKRLALSYNAVRDPAQKLLLMLKEHMLHVTAENISARPNEN